MLNKSHVVELAKPFKPPLIGNEVNWLILYLKSLSKPVIKQRMEGESTVDNVQSEGSMNSESFNC